MKPCPSLHGQGGGKPRTLEKTDKGRKGIGKKAENERKNYKKRPHISEKNSHTVLENQNEIEEKSGAMNHGRNGTW